MRKLSIHSASWCLLSNMPSSSSSGCCLTRLWSCSLTTLSLSFLTCGKTDTICITNSWSHGKGDPRLLPLSSFVKDSFTFKNLVHHFKCFIHISSLQFPLSLKEGLVLYSFLEGEQKSEPPISPTAAATCGAGSSESGQCFSCSGITGTLIMHPHQDPMGWVKNHAAERLSMEQMQMSSLSQKQTNKKQKILLRKHLAPSGGTVSRPIILFIPQPMLYSQGNKAQGLRSWALDPVGVVSIF